MKNATHDLRESNDAATSAPGAARSLPEASGETLRLPDHQERGVRFDYAGERHELEFDAQVEAALQSVCARHEVTPFLALLAAFAATLQAETRQTDLTLCTPVLGRQNPRLRGVIGYFNNILPLRLDLSGDPTLGELVERSRRAALAAFSHPDLPLHELAELPELAKVSLTRCLFAVQSIPGLTLRLPGLTASHRDLPGGTANFDLALFLENRGGRTHLMVDHKIHVLDSAVGEALGRALSANLLRLAGSPGAKLSEIPGSGIVVTSAPPPEPVPGFRSRYGTLLQTHLLRLWRRAFGNPSLGPDDDFFAEGGDSLRASELFALIRRELGADLPLATLFEAPTARSLAERLGRQDWTAPWASVVEVQPAGSRLPLFLVHGGGGNVIAFRALSDVLGPDRPLFCLQAKGLRAGEKPLETIEEMAEHYLESVRRVRPSGPYLLGGHSLGALVAYEMAQRLLARGEQVPLVALLDHPGPDARLSSARQIRYHLRNLSTLGHRDRMEYVGNHLRWKLRSIRAGGRGPQPAGAAASSVREAAETPQRAGVRMMETSLRAMDRYRVRPFPGSLTLFRARQGEPRILADPFGGWNGMAPGRVEVCDVPGTHMSMLSEPHVRELGAALGECLHRLEPAAD